MAHGMSSSLLALLSLVGCSANEVPRMLLLGTQKAATTSIWSLLDNADMGVCGSKDWVSGAGSAKESHFFDMSESEFPYGNIYQKYKSQFHGSHCNHYLDATPAYLYEGFGPMRMTKMNNHHWQETVKMLVVIREPIARDLAFYNHMKSNWHDHPHKQETDMGDIETHLCKRATANSFPSYKKACSCKIRDWKNNCEAKHPEDRAKAYHYCALYSGGINAGHKEIERKTGYEVRKNQNIMNRLPHGMYKPQIQGYAKKFSRSQIMVVDFDRMLNNQEEYIKDIVEFYDLPYSEHAHKLKKLPAENEKIFSGKVKTMSCHTRKRLQDIFSPYNKDVFEYLRDTHHEAPGHEPKIEYSSHFLTQVDCFSHGEEVYVLSSAGNFTTAILKEDDDEDEDFEPDQQSGPGVAGLNGSTVAGSNGQQGDPDVGGQKKSTAAGSNGQQGDPDVAGQNKSTAAGSNGIKAGGQNGAQPYLDADETRDAASKPDRASGRASLLP